MTEAVNPPLLVRGSHGQDVIHLQAALARAGCFDADIDGHFGQATESALRLLQQRQGLPVTGLFTPVEQALLAWSPLGAAVCPESLLAAAKPLFAPAVANNLAANLPAIWSALSDFHLNDAAMLGMALSTIRVETANFLPVSEPRSSLNSTATGHFDLYDHKPGLGNQGAPDGANFRGRGFIQLTGRANYARIGAACQLGAQLVADPYRAHESATAARLLAAFLKNREPRIRAALANNNLDDARKAVNGGLNGLNTFVQTLQLSQTLLPPALATMQP